MVSRRDQIVATMLGFCLIVGLLGVTVLRVGCPPPNPQLPSIESTLADLQSSRPETRRTAARTLGEAPTLEPDAIRRLAETLLDPDVEVRIATAQALYQHADQAEPIADALIAACNDRSEAVRGFAFNALLVLGNDVQEALARQRNDPDERTRLRAADLALRLGVDREESLGTLRQALDSPNSDNRCHAAIALATRAGESAALSGLRDALRSDQASVRRDGLIALRLLDARAAPAAEEVVRCTSDNDATIRSLAAETLARLTDLNDAHADAIKLCLKDPDVTAKPAILHALERHGEKGVPLLLLALEDRDPATRAAAFTILGSLGPRAKAAVPDLLRLLGSDQAPYQAVTALARISLDDAFPVLLDLVRDGKYPARRNAALSALRSVPPEKARQAVPVLMEFLREEGNSGRHLALDTLGSYGPIARDAEPIVRALASGEDVELRGYAADALKRIGKD